MEKNWFTIIEGPEVGTQFNLEKNEIWIGREKGLELSINNLEVSRRHAKLIFKDGNYFIDDNRSTNGTFVNGVKVAIPTKLLNGDIIKVGSQISIKFESFSSDPDATVVTNNIPKVSESKKLQPELPPVASAPPPINNNISSGSLEKSIKAPPNKEKSAKRTKLPGWVIILLIIMIIIIILCIIPVIIIELGDLWCNGWLGNIFQSIAPGSCY